MLKKHLDREHKHLERGVCLCVLLWLLGSHEVRVVELKLQNNFIKTGWVDRCRGRVCVVYFPERLAEEPATVVLLCSCTAEDPGEALSL